MTEDKCIKIKYDEGEEKAKIKGVKVAVKDCTPSLVPIWQRRIFFDS